VKKKLYIVASVDEHDRNHYEIYESLEDAVTSEESNWDEGQVEVYEAKTKSLGTYETGIKIVKVRK
jgi:hypothetical protein